MTVRYSTIKSTRPKKTTSNDLETRATKILHYLFDQNTWLSAKDINNEFSFVHSTLWKALRFLQDSKFVISCRSLSDTRVTLYRASPDLDDSLEIGEKSKSYA